MYPQLRMLTVPHPKLALVADPLPAPLQGCFAWPQALFADHNPAGLQRALSSFSTTQVSSPDLCLQILLIVVVSSNFQFWFLKARSLQGWAPSGCADLSREAGKEGTCAKQGCWQLRQELESHCWVETRRHSESQTSSSHGACVSGLRRKWKKSDQSPSYHFQNYFYTV